MEKKLSEITRDEWIAIRWVDVTLMGHTERTFIPSHNRTPNEAAQAAWDWDETIHARIAHKI